jgi:hypothetical protein
MFEDFARTVDRIGVAIQSVIEGNAEAVRLVLTVLLAEGHVLIEDVPGVGKTMLAKTLARAVDCSVSRIQFTPDLLPSDITGVSAYVPETREFEFKPGPVFANIVLGDISTSTRRPRRWTGSSRSPMPPRYVPLPMRCGASTCPNRSASTPSTWSRRLVPILACGSARHRGRPSTWSVRVVPTRRSTGAIM